MHGMDGWPCASLGQLTASTECAQSACKGSSWQEAARIWFTCYKGNPRLQSNHPSQQHIRHMLAGMASGKGHNPLHAASGTAAGVVAPLSHSTPGSMHSAAATAMQEAARAVSCGREREAGVDCIPACSSPAVLAMLAPVNAGNSAWAPGHLQVGPARHGAGHARSTACLFCCCSNQAARKPCWCLLIGWLQWLPG